MMERALKERIIGAVVLVAIVVLVVPVFLDGPPEEGEIVSERVLLPGQEDQKTQTVVLDRDRSEPVPVASKLPPTDQPVASKLPPTSQPEPEPVASKLPPTSEPELEPVASELPPTDQPVASKLPPTDQPVATSTTGMFAVQLGSFSNKENADKLAADLRKQGYAAFLSEVRTNSGIMHRVRIGPQKDRESSEAMATRLAKVGHDGKVVPHP